MRAETDWVTGVGIGRIQDKPRWTKALGEAATVVYGDCNEDIGSSQRRRTDDRETSGPHSGRPASSTG